MTFAEDVPAGELRLEYLPDDREFDDSRYGASFKHAHSFLPRLTGTIDYNRVSDDRYFVDLASQVRQVTVGNLNQDGHLNYSGRLGRFPYSAQARVQKFQTLHDLQLRTVLCVPMFSGEKISSGVCVRSNRTTLRGMKRKRRDEKSRCRLV